MTAKGTRIVSKSGMRVFGTCPAQWRYKNEDAPQTILDTSALDFGNSVHENIAHYYEEIESKNLDYITKEGIAESLKRHLGNVEGDAVRINKILVNMIDYEVARLNKYGKECFKPVLIEKRFDIPPFKGIVDIVFSVKAGTKDVMVVDWKSGKYNPSEWDNDGITIYSFFMEHEGYKVVQGTTVFVEHGMKTLAVVDYDKVAAKAANYFKKTENPNYHFPKKREWTCKWCVYILICLYEDDKGFNVETVSETEKMMFRYEATMKVSAHA